MNTNIYYFEGSRSSHQREFINMGQLMMLTLFTILTNTKMTGTVKFYNSDKGYGFIKDDDSDAEYFFHMKQCFYEPVFKNDRVRFIIEDCKSHDGKVRAVDVEKL